MGLRYLVRLIEEPGRDGRMVPTGRFRIQEVDLFIGERFLITVHRAPLPFLDDLRERWRLGYVPQRPTLADAAHCRRSSHYRGGMSKNDLRHYRIEKLGKLSPEELGPMPKPENVYRSGFSLSLDAFNRFSEKKFPFPALSDTPIDPDPPAAE